MPYASEVLERESLTVDDELAAFLQSGVAALAATADADLVPDGTRVWGCAVAPAGDRLRILVPVTATQTLANLATTGRIAVCFTDVVVYRSVQIKGAAVELPGRALPSDLALFKSYRDALFTSIAKVGLEYPAVAGFIPVGVVPVVIDVQQMFDQTPGPGAGRHLSGRP
ncbi:MAG: hypothetical protein JWL70_2864 [Acidimicrobiia bacterium]|nr:hypothetical protein [Acidimicrobiia bacterium]